MLYTSSYTAATTATTATTHCRGLTLPSFDKATGDLWCPFNLYRTSADVYAEWPSVLHNLFSTIPFQDMDVRFR